MNRGIGMKQRKRILTILAAAVGAVLLMTGGAFLFLKCTDWGFAREVSDAERSLRLETVTTAQEWLGSDEGGREHLQLIEIYNAHEPLAQGYAVTAEDNWCAAFGSSIAIQCGLTDIVPTECGCQRQIGLWQELGRWEENDNYMPLPGDYIYYAWDEPFRFGDCTGWADHVGIVVGTAGPFIKVIEGNKNDTVAYRIILRGDWQIRGYGLPDYASLTK